MHHFSTPQEIRQLLDQALTVAGLIDILEQYDPETKVVFACDYGDITHTKQALAVGSVQHLDSDMGCSLVESAYSNSGVAIEECESFDESDKQIEFDVVVLS